MADQTRHLSAGQVILDHLREQVDELVVHDAGVRADEPDAVHRMRVATRRLRSTMATYRPFLDGPGWEHSRAELKWIGELLGRARDAEVLRSRLDRRVRDLAPVLVLGPVLDRIHRELQARATEARYRLLAALDSGRYLALLAELAGLMVDAPLSDQARAKATAALRRRVVHAGRRVERADRTYRRGQRTPEADQLAHEVRKAAKRARYAAESAAPVLGRPAARMARRMKEVQDLLGEVQDSVSARQVLRPAGVRADLSGENGFTFGLLYGLELCEAECVLRQADPVIEAALEATARVRRKK